MLKNNKILLDYFTGRMPNHEAIKDNLINAIKKSQGESYEDENQRIIFTDYSFSNTPRSWIDIFYPNIQPYLFEMASFLKCNKYMINQIWFQIYNKGDYHGWHTHIGCNFTNVYFLQLPNKTMKTQLYNNETIDLNEGDILTIPSYLLHRSIENSFDEQKIIISFNTNFEEWNGQ